MTDLEEYRVWVDHGYEGESERYFADLAAAVAYWAAKQGEPGVMRAYLTDAAGDSVCSSCGTVFAYDSATQESVCQCGRTLD